MPAVEFTLIENYLEQYNYSQLKCHYDHTYRSIWYYMNPKPRPCFTPILIKEIGSFQQQTSFLCDQSDDLPVQYLVLASTVPDVFNLGGDLNLFQQLIRSGNRDSLFTYAKSCIDVLYTNMISLGHNLTTISLVQGHALGGGFEAAISGNVLIAEQSARFGFPEIRFNLFPGMGAYSILSRKIGGAKAEQIILSGKIYTADELHQMGIIDMVVEDGQGEFAVNQYIKREQKSHNGFQALQESKRFSNPVTYQELINVVNVWVDAALRLADRDLRLIERIASRQIALV